MICRSTVSNGHVHRLYCSLTRLLISISVGALAVLVAPGCTPHSGADLILYNGTVISLNKYYPPTEALAIVDGKVLAVGFNEEIKPLASWKTRRINLRGATVIPGLTDAHMHLLSFGRSLEEISLVGTSSPEEVTHRVKEAAQELPSGVWIQGRGWDQNDWAVKEFPDRHILDEAAPDHPVFLRRIDGHAVWVNTQALRLANILADTPDPDGGQILRDKEGQPTGILIDNAMDLLEEHIPAATRADVRRRLLAAMQRLNRVGLTGVHDAGVDSLTLSVIKELIDESRFTLRYYGMLDGEDDDLLTTYYQSGPVIEYGDRLTVRSVKFYIDGALGSRGAALLQPYSDDPGNRGLLVTNPESLKVKVARAMQAGFQPCIHAIGDRGNHLVLNIYEELLRLYPGKDLRPRIEHAQVLAPADIPRFAHLGALPSMQPSHATSDMTWAEDRLGPGRILGAYAWRKLLETGVVIPGGSDCPVEREDPLLQIYAARTRQDASGWPPEGWYHDQRMSGVEAVKALTIWAAYAAFQEQYRGQLVPGHDADFTVLSVNPAVCNPPALLTARVFMTVIGGEVVWYDRKGFRETARVDINERPTD
jgi:predicted amidohydrolase YtcJ